jgi:hypothetical protein
LRCVFSARFKARCSHFWSEFRSFYVVPAFSDARFARIKANVDLREDAEKAVMGKGGLGVAEGLWLAPHQSFEPRPTDRDHEEDTVVILNISPVASKPDMPTAPSTPTCLSATAPSS